jgi:hypothetical protein
MVTPSDSLIAPNDRLRKLNQVTHRGQQPEVVGRPILEDQK